MQDFRSMQASIGGGGGRIFGGGDRRVRPFPNQALKCPRCESLNTKFCYYNNYNLSQPRHFCKSCRRYWTKGGVLRNVPIGGGCRKTKRSSKQKQPSQHEDKEESKTSTADNSSSDSSSLTNNTTTEAAAAVASTSTPGLIHNNNNNNNNNNVFSFNFEASMLDTGGGLLAEIGGSFTSMMTVSNPTSSSFLMYNNLSEISPQLQQEEEELKMQELTGGGVGSLDQTVPVDFRGMSSQDELTALDWQNGGGDQTTLFDLPNSSVVDHGYWGQSQWTTTDHDQHLYLPP